MNHHWDVWKITYFSTVTLPASCLKEKADKETLGAVASALHSIIRSLHHAFL